MGARGRSGLDICEWVCSGFTETPSALWAGLWLTGCVVRVCKASKDPVARRALKAASSQQFLSVGIFSLQIEPCIGFIGLHVPRMTLGLPLLSSIALHSQHFLLPSDSQRKNPSPAMSFGSPTCPLHFFKTLWFLEVWSGAQQGRRSSRPILIPALGVYSSSWSHIFKAALGKQRYCGEAKAARSLVVSGKSDSTPDEGSRCLQLYSNPTDPSKCPFPQTPLREPCLMPLGIWPLLFCLVTVGPAPANLEAEIAPGPGCPASQTALHTTLCQQKKHLR